MILSSLSACQSISKSAEHVSGKVLDVLGLEKKPEIDAQSMLDLAKEAQQKYEQLRANLPKNQWVYLENPQLGTADLQNQSNDLNILSLHLNCKSAAQRASFTLTGRDGKIILKAYDDSAGQIQFLLDSKNFGNPFSLYSTQKLEDFKKALPAAKTIKIFNASKLYSFQNQRAELLFQPVSCTSPA
ncbi:hypothetical protein [Acinetobacter tianfuensis]|uniref:hypothetical protein n=1 Tax=Acinetobacter tianfuensis TaxID=2419603 RepID=UPI0026C1A34A|nr:hypothetical protein [Acinetobacter tianfuensis]